MDRRTFLTTCLIALGGAVGGLARYGVDLMLAWHPPQFPWATFWVNILGCIGIGAFLVWALEGPATPWWLRPFVAIGVIGGFTTFSAFAAENVLLADDGALATAGLYTAAMLTTGLIAVWMSATLTRRLLLPHGA
ncbi:MAG: CrcB family protein [Candidatus Nanopelagicales bacterium]